MDVLGVITPHKTPKGKIGSVMGVQMSMSKSGKVKFCLSADLKDRKEKALAAAGDFIGKGTSIEVGMDLDTGKGMLEVSGVGANALTGKVKAVVGLFRGKRKSTKAGSDYQGDAADFGEDTRTVKEVPKEKPGWGEWLMDAGGSFMAKDNLEGRTWAGKKLQKAIGETLYSVGEVGTTAGIKGTWRVAVGWDLNLDGSGSDTVCTDDCASGGWGSTFEEDPMSLSIEAEAKVSAQVKLLGSEHKIGGGFSISAEVNTDGEIVVSANAKAQHSQDGHSSNYKASASVYGGGGGPTGMSVTNTVGESLQDCTFFARAPNERRAAAES